MLRQSKLVRGKNVGFYIIIEFSQLLLNDFPCVTVIMCFEILNVFEYKIFRPVLRYNRTDVIE